MLISAHAAQLPLPSESVQCVVTSPPYWGLRKYAGEQDVPWFSSDARCAFGLEPTIELYIEHTREILREVWRVLRADGVCFWNLGDSYAGSWGAQGRTNGGSTYNKSMFSARQIDEAPRKTTNTGSIRDEGLKPKDLCLIPERVAIAAQADGWWVRSMIIWAKPNPMPESVSDRPTDAYEHIIMLTKSERHFWDADAVREPAVTDDMRCPYTSEGAWEMDGRPPEQRHGGELRAFGYKSVGTHSRGTGTGGPKAKAREEEGVHQNWAEKTREIVTSRNLRNVWVFPTQPYAGAHFATFPEEIPRRCILAATSALGCCRQCGAPWQRVMRVGGGTIGKGS